MLELHPARTALVLIDMQNGFFSAAGPYPRNGLISAEINALPAILKPVTDAFRKAGSWIVSTHFTIVPGKGGHPLVLDHIRKLRPFFQKGDFAPGNESHALIDMLQPSDLSVEKVTYSAFYMSRLEFVLQRAAVDTLVFAGIVTNGGVSFSACDAHMRGFRSIILSDGCAAFDRHAHDSTIESLSTMMHVSTCKDVIQALI